MGYYTNYSLTWTEGDAGIGEAIAAREDMYFALDSDGSTKESCKWYDHETDMKSLSRIFPAVLFTLSGEGEESGDIWMKYFRDGKMQICKAVLDFPKFNAKLLK